MNPIHCNILNQVMYTRILCGFFVFFLVVVLLFQSQLANR